MGFHKENISKFDQKSKGKRISDFPSYSTMYKDAIIKQGKFFFFFFFFQGG